MKRVFTLPYDCGQRNVRMGAGPVYLAERLGLPAEEIQPASSFPQEIRTSFELYSELATRVMKTDDFPVVLSGHCGASIGAAAGLDVDDLAILWFDAHGDYNTPETTDTGFLDGMCLSVLTGRCWRGLANRIPNFRPVDPRRVVHVGARDWSPGERDALLADGVRIGPDFDGIDARYLLVHIDLDVIDARYGRANHFACEGGLMPDDILRVLERASRQFEIEGLVLASYDPSCDTEGKIAEAAVRFVQSFE